MTLTTQKKAVSIITDLVEMLSNLESGERHKAITAALTLLGDTGTNTMASGNHRASSPSSQTETDTDHQRGAVNSGAMWMKQHNVSQQQLEHIFHFENGKVSLIISKIPGTSVRAQTGNACILEGLRSYLETKEPIISNEKAKNVCRSYGCYDSKNFAGAVKGLGNKITGGKGSSLKLTQPGLAAAAQLVNGGT